MPITPDSAMNEEVNFCDQCGLKINSGAKFCSNCGHDLQNSSTQVLLDKAIKTQTPLDKTIKIELTNTNATVEKGFEAIGKVFKRKKKNVSKEWTEAELLDEINYLENTERHPSKANKPPTINGFSTKFLILLICKNAFCK
jgi:hypothetical protein